MFAVGMSRAVCAAAAMLLLLHRSLLLLHTACCTYVCEYGLLLLAMHIERLAPTCYLLWSFLTKYKTCQETRLFRQTDVISMFVTNREDVKFLTKSRQNDVAIRDQKTLFLF